MLTKLIPVMSSSHMHASSEFLPPTN